MKDTTQNTKTVDANTTIEVSEELKLALNRIAELEKVVEENTTITARLTSTQDANAFHIAVSQMFSAEQLKKLFEKHYIKTETTQKKNKTVKCYLFDTNMRKDLIELINNKLHN